MAQVTGGDAERVYGIRKFLGLREAGDGDTALELGEASSMDNWQVTAEGQLRVRPGLETCWQLSGAIRGLWCGELGGETRLVAAAGGSLWRLEASGGKTAIGTLTDDETSFFVFGDKLYVLNGHEYLSWSGSGQAAAVEGYVPLVVTAAAPAGGGTALEPVNRLTAKRRCRFSADGSSVLYQLPETNVASVEQVQVGGSALSDGAYTLSGPTGRVSFVHPPAEGVNNVEIWYTAAESLRSQVTAMRFAETYNGVTDTRVFLYGDGSNRTLYSGVTEAGAPSAEYFPDLYEIAVDGANTPITGMMKQYAYLMVFKPDGAFSTQYSAVTLDDGTVTAGFCVSPVNREIGNDTPGQVRSVYNYPRTLYAGNLYDWQSAAAGRDERRARLVSGPVARSLRAADPAAVRCFDNDREQEFFVFLHDGAGTALVHRYGDGAGIWYRYTGLKVRAAVRDGAELYFGLADGRVCRFTETAAGDDGQAIPCRWVSGAMDFGADCQRKSQSLFWVTLKPGDDAELSVTAETDRRRTYAVRRLVSRLAGLDRVDFGRFSFRTNPTPQVQRLRLKVRRFTRCRLVLACSRAGASTTVLGLDARVRFGRLEK